MNGDEWRASIRDKDWPAVEDTPDYMPPVRGVGAPAGHLSMTGADKRNELLRGAITDARIQLDTEKALARISGGTSGADVAERYWRATNPGLAALVDHADGA